jgi:glutathione S-transferase
MHAHAHTFFCRLLQASGGKVPVLRQAEQNLVMPDSDVITAYLEKQFPEISMVSQAPADL